MKHRILIPILISFLCSTFQMNAQQRIRFMPQWNPQAQFAGYYVALEKGYYDGAGLDVVISHTGPYARYNVSEYLRKGQVDAITLMLPQGIRFHSRSLDIVNILQTSQNCSLCLVSQTPVNKIEDFEGMNAICWSRGFSEVAMMACWDHGVFIHWIPSLSGIGLYIKKAADATLALSHNDIVRLHYAVGGVDDSNIFYFGEHGYNYPEDGLYVRREFYEEHKDAVEKFRQASIRGWEYAVAHPREAAECVVRMAAKSGNKESVTIQEEMLKNVIKQMTNPKTGKVDFAPASREVFEEIREKLNDTGFVTDNVDYEKIILK